MLNGIPGTGIAKPRVGCFNDSPALGGVGGVGGLGGSGIENGMPGTGIARPNVGGIGVLHLDMSRLSHDPSPYLIKTHSDSSL